MLKGKPPFFVSPSFGEQEHDTFQILLFTVVFETSRGPQSSRGLAVQDDGYFPNESSSEASSAVI